jgi:DNA-binding response OmpR family regulator
MSRKKALVVDDSQDWRSDLEELLREKNYDVLAAKDRATAISLLSTHVFDIVVLDVNLSDESYNVDGLLINQELKQKNLKTLIILISARDLTAEELENIKPSIFVEKSRIWDALNSRILD